MTPRNPHGDPPTPDWPKAPSRMAALLPADEAAPTPGDIKGRLMAADIQVEGFTRYADKDPERGGWTMAASLRVQGREEPGDYVIGLRENVGELPDLLWEPKLTQGEREQALKSAHAITVETEFGDEPLADFHRHARVLVAAAPGAVAFLDGSAAETHSGAWLRDLAAAGVPPGATATFRIHAVAEGEGRAERVWLHTHGLRRLGLPELEIVDVPQSAAGTLGEVINAMANAFLCFGMPPAGEPFGPGGGKSGGLLWLPLEQALPHLPRGMWIDDRDEGHSEAVVLLSPPGLFSRRYRNPATLVKGFERHPPVVPLSNAETERMAALAKERLPRFAYLQSRYSEDTDNWIFLIHVGLPVDPEFQEDEDAPEREHLWFQVHALRESEFEATLVNQPIGIKALREGQRGTWSLEGLSDWAILGTRGQFDPSSIFFLERQLAEEQDGS